MFIPLLICFFRKTFLVYNQSLVFSPVIPTLVGASTIRQRNLQSAWEQRRRYKKLNNNPLPNYWKLVPNQIIREQTADLWGSSSVRCCLAHPPPSAHLIRKLIYGGIKDVILIRNGAYLNDLPPFRTITDSRCSAGTLFN